jgi:bifunctional non-homologous end joining protein LigD
MKVAISNPDKVLFEDAGVTKADLARYYQRVSDRMLPHLRGRPISMQRFPDGIGAEGFFHKDVPDYFPDWIERVKVRKRGGSLTQVIVRDRDTLRYLVDQATITPHVWLSRADNLERPDRMVFDLDPSRRDFPSVRRAARELGSLLDDLGLPRFAMTTGSRGIHVWVPLRREAGFDEVREFARDVARELERRHPDLLTTAQRKAKRGDAILVDVMRNAYAQTAVPPYAVRPKPKAPVAMPLEWEELSDSRLKPDRWTTSTALRRLSRKRGLWSGFGRAAVSLRAARKRLDRLRERGEA